MVSNASRRAGGCEQSYRNVLGRDGSWERRHTCSEGGEPEEVEEDAPGRVGWEQAVKGPGCPLHLLSWFPSLGIRISSVAFWLLQTSLHYFT